MTITSSEGSHRGSNQMPADNLAARVAQWLRLSRPQNGRDYLHAGLLLVTPVLVVIGLVALGLAVSFEGYVAAVMILALAGCTFVGARELTPKDASAAVLPPIEAPNAGSDEPQRPDAHG